MKANRRPREQARRSCLGRRPSRILVGFVGALAGLVLAGTAAASTICNNFGGTICCGTQSWGSFSNTSIASWSGDAGKRYYARRRDLNFVLTFNQLMPNGGALTKDFGTDNVRGTGLYRGEQPLMNYAVSDATRSSC